MNLRYHLLKLPMVCLDKIKKYLFFYFNIFDRQAWGKHLSCQYLGDRSRRIASSKRSGFSKQVTG